MKIVIGGAGGVGYNLAELLSLENHEVVLLDVNENILNYSSENIDLLTVRGDANSIKVLLNTGIEEADLYIGVTTFEDKNLVSAMLAKKLGAKKTVARVSNLEFLTDINKEYFLEMGVDNLIVPHELAAQEIRRLVERGTFSDFIEFDGGIINLAGIIIEQDSAIHKKNIIQIYAIYSKIEFKIVAVLRGNQTYIPDDMFEIRRRDHVFIMIDKKNLKKLVEEMELKEKNINNIMLLGGTDVAIRTAQILDETFNIKIIEKDKEICKKYVENIKNGLVINGDCSNIELLKQENIDKMDAFIALTGNSETNIISSLLAEQNSMSIRSIALVDNSNYTPISHRIGVESIINKKILAANKIFTLIRKGKVETIEGLHGTSAEVIEFSVNNLDKIKMKLKDLKFPKNTKICSIIRENTAFFPQDDFNFQLNDKVIFIALPGSISDLVKFFA